ncbi:glycosyltransferase family 4 protein [Arsukibacterium perlucidum]|uniref:glycosyltransferase family 4 protein n=1 Tax=Arsukibacterium perlucidum TaxID=368811 RepID=UPI001969DDBD|nr:glycosyltransferase family 4 protein [Arsukibacterium perlucidum]
MRKTLLFIVNVDWFFVSHRLPIALKAQSDGYDVHIMCNFTDKYEHLSKLGFTLHEVPFDRSGGGFLHEFKTLCVIWSGVRKIKPDILHAITIKPVLYGGLIARLANVKLVVFAVSGLGLVFVADGIKARIRRSFVKALYKLAFGVRSLKVIFQNPVDKAVLQKVVGLKENDCVMIKGSGADLNEYHYVEEPANEVPVIIMAARLLREKGVYQFVDTARAINSSTKKARFLLVGEPDHGNPNSITEAEIDNWKREGFVEFLGFRDDIASLFSLSNLVVLPSFYGEGLPKVLIEAAACGRAIVTTDNPGCAEALIDGVTGLIVPTKNVVALTEAIRLLIESPEKRKEMGVRGREFAEREFDVESVVLKHLEIYATFTPKMVFVVNIAKFFLSHWLPEAEEARRKGYDVHVATMAGPEVPQIIQAGLTHHVIPLSRSGKNIFAELKSFFYLLKLFRQLQPTLVHLMTIKPVIYGGLAARITKVPGVLAVVTGLGYVFIHQGVRAVLVRSLVSFLYKRVFAHPNLLAVFENDSDMKSFLDSGIVVPGKARIINGAGVDLEQYDVVPEPTDSFTVTFAARLLKDKGFSEFVAAARLLKLKYPELRFWVAGDTDEGNPASISPLLIQQLEKEQLVEFLGFRDDIPQVFANSNLVVLPSYREGFPKVLIEAASCGRAIITTDVPGCRHAIVDGETGILVPVKKVQPLADAIEYLFLNEAQRFKMAENGRLLALQKYNINNTVSAYFELYSELESETLNGR